MSKETTVLKEKTAFLPKKTPFLVDQNSMSGRVPLVHSHSHYYSKLYTSQISINPLIAAASPLLTLLGRLRNSDYHDEISELYLDLIHEMKSFESYAQRLNYRAETILIARYILASTIDETILNTPWGHQKGWEKHKLLMFFQQEEWGGERFFVILERLEEEPLFYIDLLELVYLCLNLGYEGKFRFEERGHLPLEMIIKNLFIKIQQIRHELKPDLNPKKLPPPVKTKTITVLIPIRLFFISALFSLLLVGSSFTSQQWQQFNPLNHFSSLPQGAL